MSHAATLRALRGAPLSIWLSLALDGPAGRADLVAATGYSTGAVASGLATLETLGAVERLHHRAWRINPAWRDLPLPISAEFTPPAPPPIVIHSLSTGAPAVPSADSERSHSDPSTDLLTTNPKSVQIPHEVDGSPGDPSAAEGSCGDPSASGLVGYRSRSNTNNQAAPTKPNQLPAAWPIDHDQTGRIDAELWHTCRSLGIGEPVRTLVAGCATIQARGPAYVRQHVSRAARDRNRAGSAIGLAINRIYRLLPALDCGDCMRCATCQRVYGVSAESAYTDYADVIRR